MGRFILNWCFWDDCVPSNFVVSDWVYYAAANFAWITIKEFDGDDYYDTLKAIAAYPDYLDGLERRFVFNCCNWGLSDFDL